VFLSLELMQKNRLPAGHTGIFPEPEMVFRWGWEQYRSRGQKGW
jgi:hypothetical protein